MTRKVHSSHMFNLYSKASGLPGNRITFLLITNSLCLSSCMIKMYLNCSTLIVLDINFYSNVLSIVSFILFICTFWTFFMDAVQVFEFLKGAISRNFKDEQVQHGSKFLRDLLPPYHSISQMILDTVRNRSVLTKRITYLDYKFLTDFCHLEK